MNERTLRPAHMAAAALAVGGALIVIVPEHAMSIGRLLIVTVAAAAGLYALALTTSPTWWLSPFDGHRRRRGLHERPDEIEWIRASFGGRRQRIADDVSLPPGALRLLQPLIRVALEREPSRRLSPLSRAILESNPLKRPTWIRTGRPDRRETASIVHRVLDDLLNRRSK
jgi:hypothetical protein